MTKIWTSLSPVVEFFLAFPVSRCSNALQQRTPRKIFSSSGKFCLAGRKKLHAEFCPLSCFPTIFETLSERTWREIFLFMHLVSPGGRLSNRCFTYFLLPHALLVWMRLRCFKHILPSLRVHRHNDKLLTLACYAAAFDIKRGPGEKTVARVAVCMCVLLTNIVKWIRVWGKANTAKWENEKKNVFSNLNQFSFIPKLSLTPHTSLRSAFELYSSSSSTTAAYRFCDFMLLSLFLRLRSSRTEFNVLGFSW